MCFVSFQYQICVPAAGELGDSFYLIQSGEASVHLPDGSAKSLYTGDHFGERAFLATNTLRSASVFAVTNLECLVTDRNTFERLLGNLGVYVSQLDNLSQNMKMNLDDLIVRWFTLMSLRF